MRAGKIWSLHSRENKNLLLYDLLEAVKSVLATSWGDFSSF